MSGPVSGTLKERPVELAGPRTSLSPAEAFWRPRNPTATDSNFSASSSATSEPAPVAMASALASGILPANTDSFSRSGAAAARFDAACSFASAAASAAFFSASSSATF